MKVNSSTLSVALLLAGTTWVNALPRSPIDTSVKLTAREALRLPEIEPAPRVPEIDPVHPDTPSGPESPGRMPEIEPNAPSDPSNPHPPGRQPEIEPSSPTKPTDKPDPTTKPAPTTKTEPTTKPPTSKPTPTTAKQDPTTKPTSKTDPTTKPPSSKPSPTDNTKPTATADASKCGPRLTKRAGTCEPIKDGGQFQYNYDNLRSYLGFEEDKTATIDAAKLTSTAKQSFEDFKKLFGTGFDTVMTGSLKMPDAGYIFASKPRAGVGNSQKLADDIVDDARQNFPKWVSDVWEPRVTFNAAKKTGKLADIDMIHVEDMLMIQGMKYWRSVTGKTDMDLDIPDGATGSVYGRPQQSMGVDWYNPCSDTLKMRPSCTQVAAGRVNWIKGDASAPAAPAGAAGPAQPKL